MKINLFVCLTTLHAYFSFVEAHRLYQSMGECSLLILKGNYSFEVCETKYMHVRYVRNTTKLNKLFYWICYKHLFRYTQYNRIVNNRCKRVYYFNNNDPLTKNIIKAMPSDCELIYMEEGMGSWNAKWDDLYFPEREMSVMVGKPEIFRLNFPSFKGEIRKLNYDFYFSDIYLNKFWKNCCCDIETIDIDIIYLGTVDQKNKEKKQVLKQIYEIAECCNYDTKIYIKPHPRDKSNRYSKLCEMDDRFKIMSPELNEMPVECIASRSKVKLVVSEFSSGGFYIPIVSTNTSSIFLCNMDTNKEHYEKIGIENFKNCLEEGKYYFPQNIDELKAIIQSFGL